VECNLYFRKETPVGGIVGSVVLTPDSSGAIVQLVDGTLFLYKSDKDEMTWYSEPLPEACETVQVLLTALAFRISTLYFHIGIVGPNGLFSKISRPF
jgi:hypothetical protein